ncbi:hypothetical protein J5U23_02846 [Saccharolobus shibatae B12]|uniref:Uncharacterized protein n=1 Tax=Saccharolobus shibatae (strain ATCC 51178 / DSM 5389 / JCM 8931 / NBRC 15437 / B12) TaxID=523848 RepID=A0A8F5BR60_SACSH|nr:hypothetical protein J5U23_02846 [Saccharolobus shibatae B12]
MKAIKWEGRGVILDRAPKVKLVIPHKGLTPDHRIRNIEN